MQTKTQRRKKNAYIVYKTRDVFIIYYANGVIVACCSEKKQ